MARALSALGCEVHAHDERPRAWRPFAGPLPRRLERLLRRVRPDVVLVYKGEHLAPDAVASLRGLGGRWVHWFPDSPHVLDHALRLAAPYEVRYVFDTWMVERYREAGLAAEFLPEAVDPSFNRPIPGAPPSAAIAFVGTREPLRDRALESIHDLGVRAWGPGWPAGPLFGDRFIRAFAGADIALNIHQFFADAPDMTRYGHGANRRTFELSGIGTVQLCDAKQDAARSFRDGEEIVLFRSIAELRDAAAGLLQDPERRASIGAAARRRALAEHTWEHRMVQLLAGVMG